MTIRGLGGHSRTTAGASFPGVRRRRFMVGKCILGFLLLWRCLGRRRRFYTGNGDHRGRYSLAAAHLLQYQAHHIFRKAWATRSILWQLGYPLQYHFVVSNMVIQTHHNVFRRLAFPRTHAGGNQSRKVNRPRTTAYPGSALKRAWGTIRVMAGSNSGAPPPLINTLAISLAP